MELITLSGAVRLFECLGAVSLLVQTAEYLRLSAHTGPTGVWAWSVQRGDLAHAGAITRKVFDVLFAEAALRAHLRLRLLVVASLFIGSSPLTAAVIFASTVVLLIRWRGAFNGGSDFMSLVFATALMIGNLSAPFIGPRSAWTAALWYACIHTLTSYLVSGVVKLLPANWREGRALTWFLDGGLYGPLAAGSIYRRPIVAIGCSWAFILWECAALLVLVDQRLAVVWCTVAAVFHLLVFRHFGLNRFFWAWVAMFPAIIHCAGRSALL